MEKEENYNHLKHLSDCGDLCFKGGKSDCCMIAVLQFILGGAGGGASGIGRVVVVLVVMVRYFW